MRLAMSLLYSCCTYPVNSPALRTITGAVTNYRPPISSRHTSLQSELVEDASENPGFGLEVVWLDVVRLYSSNGRSQGTLQTRRIEQSCGPAVVAPRSTVVEVLYHPLQQLDSSSLLCHEPFDPVLFDGMQIRHDLSIRRVGRGFLHLRVFFFAFELGARKVCALATDLQVLLLDAAGDEGAGRVLIREIGTCAAGTPGRADRVVSRAQATIKATYANRWVSLHNRVHRSCPNPSRPVQRTRSAHHFVAASAREFLCQRLSQRRRRKAKVSADFAD